MRTYEIEDWALRAIKRVEEGQPNEDARVELKAQWIDAQKAARRIAGHANEMRGEPILWVIGVDENNGVTGASQNDLATWWSQVKSEFIGPVPNLRDVLVHWNDDTAVALFFETEQVPYVIKNPVFGKKDGGAVEREVPWRDGTAIRSATHSDLILLLSPLQRPILDIEVGEGRGFFNHYPLSQTITRLERDDRTMHAPPVPTSAFYLRVKITNRGRRTARNCRVYLANVEVQQGKKCRDTEYVDFMRLVWSHHPGIPSLDLLPEVPHWVDVISTLENCHHFFLETDPKAEKYRDGFGETTMYRLTIRAYAEDAESAEAIIYLRWSGDWEHVEVFDEKQWETRKTK